MNQKGFTLIELLVVIAIIGILAGITFVTFGGSKEKADDGTSKSELVQIKKIAEVWKIGREDFNNYCDNYVDGANINTEVSRLFRSIENRQGNTNCKDDDGLEVSFSKKVDGGGGSVRLTISNNGDSDISEGEVVQTPTCPSNSGTNYVESDAHCVLLSQGSFQMVIPRNFYTSGVRDLWYYVDIPGSGFLSITNTSPFGGAIDYSFTGACRYSNSAGGASYYGNVDRGRCYMKFYTPGGYSTAINYWKTRESTSPVNLSFTPD